MNFFKIILILCFLSTFIACDSEDDGSVDPGPPSNNLTLENSEIAVSDVKANRITLTWTKASHSDYLESELVYVIYASHDIPLNTLQNVEESGRIITTVTDIDTVRLTNLTRDTTYFFNIVAVTPINERKIYASIVVKTGVTYVQSLQGRITGNNNLPVEDVIVTTFIDGIEYSTTTDILGVFTIEEVNYTPGSTFYITKTGVLMDVNPEIDGQQDWRPFDNYTNLEFFQEIWDLGDIRAQLVNHLGFTSNLLHYSSALETELNGGNVPSPYLETDDSLDMFNEVYLLSGDNTITLTFNLPVDTSYTGTNFVQLYSPTGETESISGSWNDTANVFTITANGLVEDTDRETKYHLHIAQIIRSFSESNAITEINNVSIYFNVLSASVAGGILSSAPPTLSPESEGFTAYVFDSNVVHKQNQISVISAVDNVSLTDTTFNITWPAVAGAVTYRLYYYNSQHDASGDWHQLSETSSGEVTASSTFEVTLDMGGEISGFDGQFDNGEQAKLVVTSVNSDQIESRIQDVSTPLVITDNFGPHILAASGTTYDGTVTKEGPVNSVTGNITMTFQEKMDLTSGYFPDVAMKSGLVTLGTSSATTNEWTDFSTFSISNLDFTTEIPSTSLSSAVTTGDTILPVSVANKFSVNDIITVLDTTNDVYDEITITGVDSINNELTISSAVNDYSSGSTVIMSKGAVTGITSQLMQLSSASTGATTLYPSSGSTTNFYAGMNANIYRLNAADEYEILTTVTFSAVDSSSLTLGTALGVDIPSNALLIRAGNSVSETPLRGMTSVTGLSASLDYSGSATFNLVSNIPDGVVVGDWVVIDVDNDLDTRSDRFAAEITSINTATKQVAISGSWTGTLTSGTTTLFFMGDALQVSNARDSNSNAMQTGFNTYINPVSGESR